MASARHAKDLRRRSRTSGLEVRGEFLKVTSSNLGHTGTLENPLCDADEGGALGALGEHTLSSCVVRQGSESELRLLAEGVC